MVIPSGKAAAEAIERTVRGLARRIGKRAASDLIEEYAKLGSKPTALGAIIEARAQEVLLDWFLAREGLDDGEDS
jgi:hypothetical protein